MRSLFSITDLSVEEIQSLIDTANQIIEDPDRFAHVCHRKKLATLFFEPSTRTRLSFEAAMLELGGQVIGFSSANSSSAAKGESVADTAKTISCYADIIESLEEDPAHAENVARIKAYLAVNGAKA